MSSTLTQVLVHSAEDDVVSNQVVFPLSELLRRGFAAVDNSGSTEGEPLTTARRFVDALQVGRVSLWNSACFPPLARERIHWRSMGGTEPSSVFEPVCQVPQNTSSLVFMTDGEVNDTTLLARHANVTAHLPSLLVIFRPARSANELISQCNVSVLMAHFTAARTAAVLVIRGFEDPRLIAAKGTWASLLPPTVDLNDPSLTVTDCPLVSVDAIKALPSTVGRPMRAGTVAIGDDRVIDLDALLRLEDGRQLIEMLTVTNLEDLTRSLYALGRLSKWRALLNRWLTLCDRQVEQNVLSASSSSGHSHTLLNRIHHAATAAERAAIALQLQTAMQESAAERLAERQSQTQGYRNVRAMLNTALGLITALEASGMSATSLGQLSNRARRAGTINRADILELGSLDTAGAPNEIDLVMMEEGPVALCLRAMEQTDENTSDFALDQGLVVGQSDTNAVFEPTIVALSIADRIESMDQSPLTRQRLSVCLPIISLSNEENRRAVYQRLCLVFMNELAMPHVWMIALGSILRALETCPWASPVETPTGRLLDWFASQIMQQVVLAAGTRLSPNSALPIGSALASIHQSEVLTIHSSIREASAILRLLGRYPSGAAVSEASLLGAMRARIATGIAQRHRAWLQENAQAPWEDQGPTSLAALTTSIFDTRVSATDGRHVPIAGTGRLLDTLDMVLGPLALHDVQMFAAQNRQLTDLITPGLTLVVLATLDRLNNPHVSSTQAVEIVRAAPMVAAEMAASTAGTATTDDALAALQQHLAWARVPLQPLSPFTTPYGPSTLWFYSPSGVVVDMTQGFDVSPQEAIEMPERLVERLTEHVRTVRGILMQRYYGTAPSGSLITGSIAVPMYRAMVVEYRNSGWDQNLHIPEEAATFIHQVVQRIVGRSGSPSGGNVHEEYLELEVAMLLPSLLDAIAAAPDGSFQRSEGSDHGVPLQRRVALELAGRSPGNLGLPPAAVWMPRDDPTLNDTLDLVQRKRMAARINAMRRRRQSRADVPQVHQPLTQRPVDLRAASRRMTWFLRHEAVTRPDGFVPISDVIAAVAANGSETLTIDQVLAICEEDVKGRFDVIDEGDGGLLVRANQGHTVTTVDPDQLMTPIESADDVPICLHGTYADAFQNIMRSGALNRMNRQAIQMAVGLPNDPSVRSGVRARMEIIIYIDVHRAMQRHGLRFYRSSNNVICAPGPIPVDCFLRVIRMSDGALIDLTQYQQHPS